MSLRAASLQKSATFPLPVALRHRYGSVATEGRGRSSMSDVFISYARSTAKQAQQVAETLRGLGYSVWIDDDLPAHRTYSRVIEEQMTAAKAAVVIWSVDAVQSEWVMSEANRAREDHKLVQVTTDTSRLPMPFDTIQCADLTGWTGDLDAPGWRKVVASIADLLGGASVAAASASPPPPLPSKPSIAVLPFATVRTIRSRSILPTAWSRRSSRRCRASSRFS